jgi:hypothetical protein
MSSVSHLLSISAQTPTLFFQAPTLVGQLPALIGTGGLAPIASPNRPCDTADDSPCARPAAAPDDSTDDGTAERTPQ